MRKLELVKAIDRVLGALHESNAIDFLEMQTHFLERERPKPERMDPHGPFGGEFLQVFQRYSVAASSFGPIEKELCEIFQLDVLSEPEFWTALMFSGPGEGRGFLDRARKGSSGLQKLRALIGPETDYSESMAGAKAIHGLESVSLVVLEDRGQGSKPTRLIKVLEGISALYEAHTRVLSLPADTLIVTTCDSGSDKAFDFLGLAKAIQALKETILSLWDRIFFFRERKLSATLSLIGQSLPILAEISALEEKKALGREEAEILRRKVVDGAVALGEAGAVIPEVTARRPEAFRALAAPEAKLLAPPDLPQSEESIGNVTKRKPRRKKGNA